MINVKYIEVDILKKNAESQSKCIKINSFFNSSERENYRDLIA